MNYKISKLINSKEEQMFGKSFFEKEIMSCLAVDISTLILLRCFLSIIQFICPFIHNYLIIYSHIFPVFLVTRLRKKTTIQYVIIQQLPWQL